VFEGYIKQVEGELEAKKKEWKERQEMRSKEQEAISKAIAILYSDDARDLFKKSFESQGYMLLQETQNKALSWRREQAKAVILQAARVGKDGRLVALASAMVKAGKGFDKVIEAIDKMLVLLKKEQEEDLKIKEECEKTRADDTRDAIVLSREMDDLSDNTIASRVSSARVFSHSSLIFRSSSCSFFSKTSILSIASMTLSKPLPAFTIAEARATSRPSFPTLAAWRITAFACSRLQLRALF
jgi:hypothetical protein